MFLRQLRWIVAGVAIVAAVCAGPARSKADVQILVEELDASGKSVAKQFTSGLADPVKGISFAYSLPSFGGSGAVTTSSVSGGINASLVPSFSGLLNSSFAPAQGHKLQITVTDDKFLGNGQPGTLTNSAGASTGLPQGVGSVHVDTFSRIFNPKLPNPNPQTGDPGLVPASSTTFRADGLSITQDTATASASKPGTASADTTLQVPAIALNSPYAIQQTIVITFNVDDPSQLPTNQTFGGSGGASLDPLAPPTAAVPAPGGLVLGLIALPLLGLRRTLRKRAAAV